MAFPGKSLWESQFQKSVVEVPAKTRHAVKRSAIQFFGSFMGTDFRRFDVL